MIYINNMLFNNCASELITENLKTYSFAGTTSDLCKTLSFYRAGDT